MTTTTSKIEVVINAENKPENLPNFKEIIDQCFDLGPLQVTATNIHGVQLTLAKRFDNDTSHVWVKFGRTITMGEARTQSLVAQFLNDTANSVVRAPQVYLAFTWGGFGFIIMEYIDGQICGNSDVNLVAAAVKSLITIPSPTSVPGPVGGGVIEHPFFIERTSSISYKSVEELEDHINGILSATERGGRVSFGLELRLCPSDLNRANFMKDEGNKIVAIDFGGYSFLPPSFFAFVLNQGDHSGFTQRIARKFDHSPSAELVAMVNASYALVPFSSNNIGLPKELRSRLQHPR